MITNFLDPDYIVLGGGVSQQKLIYDGLSELSSDQCYLTMIKPQLYSYEIGDSAGVLGAALLPLIEQ
jgi:fructokinase